jgi:hypothetical protein
MDNKKRRPSTEQRAKMFGYGNQIGYEASQAVARDARKQFIAAAHAEDKKRGAKAVRKKSSTTGMNAGTVGGAYLSSMSGR